MNRTREQWADVCPKTVAQTASPAAVMCLVDDALSDIARLHRQADQLRAEVEALRKDAERYRFLCNPEDADEDYLAHAVNTLNAWADKSEIDQAIDAAMAAKEGE